MMMMPLYHDSYGHGRNSNLLLLDLMKCVVLLLPPFRTIWADQNPPSSPKKFNLREITHNTVIFFNKCTLFSHIFPCLKLKIWIYIFEFGWLE